MLVCPLLNLMRHLQIPVAALQGIVYCSVQIPVAALQEIVCCSIYFWQTEMVLLWQV